MRETMCGKDGMALNGRFVDHGSGGQFSLCVLGAKR